MASDDFNRANETPIAAPWTQLAGSTGNINLASNAVTSSADGDKLYYYSGAASAANQTVQCRIGHANTDGGPVARIGSNGTFDGYLLEAFGDEYAKLVNGTYTFLLSSGTAFVASDVLRLEVEGSTLRGFANGVALANASTTDTALPNAGQGVGMFLFSASPGGMDDWQGGDYGAAAAVYMLPKFEAVPFMSNQRI